MENTFENFSSDVLSLANKMSEVCIGHKNRVVTAALALVTAHHITTAGKAKNMVLKNYVDRFEKYLDKFDNMDNQDNQLKN